MFAARARKKRKPHTLLDFHFRPHVKAANGRGVEVRLHVVYGPRAVRDLLHRWQEEETVRVFGGEGMA